MGGRSAFRGGALACALIAACTIGPMRATGDALPQVPAGFSIEVIAHVNGARELAVAPNGDLFVGTAGHVVGIVPNAQGVPEKAIAFADVHDGQAAGVTLSNDALYIGSHTGVWRVPYHTGDRTESGAPERIATVRAQDGGGHSTTSVAGGERALYASVGSSCNACTETDPSRAKIFEMSPSGSEMKAKAVNIRNAIALAIDPEDGALWAGVAGRDDLDHGHPYEIFDNVTAHAGIADYGWPGCSEDRKPAGNGIDCSAAVVPRVVFPAYETPIGAAFYPAHEAGAKSFPTEYRGGAFVALHGSWHQPPVPPRVVFVPFVNGEPAKPVDWSDPGAQWKPFVTGFQNDDGSRIGRPTGVAVGTDGSLFIADDAAGAIYRIRPK